MKIPIQVKRIRYFGYKLLLALYDTTAILGATVLAVIFRFEQLRLHYLVQHLESAPIILATYLFIFYFFRLYSYQWQFAGVEMLWSILLANILATGASIFLQVHLDGSLLPRSIIIVSFVLTTLFVGGQRVLMRTIATYAARRNCDHPRQPWDGEPKRTVILGSGQGVVEVLAALSKECAGRYQVIGILDDEPRHHGSYLRGIKVLGELDLLFDFLRRHQLDEVIIALSEADGVQLRDYVLACCRHKVAVRVVPMISKLLENPSASRGRLRMHDVTVEDLLHRPPVKIDMQQVGNYLTGARVLVTGAGGSIGSELCRHICGLQPERLILLGHGENSIYAIEQELRRNFPEIGDALVTVICDVRDTERINYILERYQPQVLFHAAAHKHVPMMEMNACEAVSNNIGGGRTIIRAAIAHGVERMVQISTDKAVNPSSVMGSTKYLCEEMVRAERDKSRTKFIIVRFGNVLGSRGSVLPLFQEQVLRGGPLTVTHQESRRFFMTIPEAASLVLQAGASRQSGNLFVLDMGKPVRIVDLAEDVIRIHGLEPYRDVNIEFCGLRAGEKLSEELFTEAEQRIARPQGRMNLVARPQYLNPATLDAVIDELLSIAARHDDRAMLAQLAAIIPSFVQVEPVLHR